MVRYKALIGPRLRARGFAAQQAEAAIGVTVLNRMLLTGRGGRENSVLPHFAWIMPLAERVGGAGRSWRDHTSGA